MDNHEVKNFGIDVIERSRSIPVLVDFWAEWCQPCRMLTPVLERLAVKYEREWILKKLNTEDHPEVAAQYQIRSIPNVKLFVDGGVADEFVGALPEASIEQWLRTAIPDKHAKALDEAERLLRLQQHEEAQRILEPILASAPDHERSRALLAVALLFSDRKRALDLVATIDASSKFSDLADSVRFFGQLFSRLDDPSALPDSPVKSDYLRAVRLAAERKFDEALPALIDIIRRERYYDDDGARKACIAIFKYLGEENEVTLRHRRDFGSALYA